MLPLPSVHLDPKGRSLHSQRGLQASAKGLGSWSLPTSGLVRSTGLSVRKVPRGFEGGLERMMILPGGKLDPSHVM